MSIAISPSQTISEGKTKILKSTGSSDELLAIFKDDATAFNGVKHEVIEGKGAINAAVSRILFEALEKSGISTCYLLSGAKDNELIYRKLTMIPLEVVVRNIALGSFCKRYGVPQGQAFAEPAGPLVELFYKSDDDPLISDDSVLALNIMPDRQALETLKQLALAANQVFKPLFANLGIICADFKLEFGRDAQGNLTLGDELSPDNFRLRDAITGEVLDKDVFRLDLGDVGAAYRKLLQRLTAGGKNLPDAKQQSYRAEVFVQSRKNIFSPESKAIQDGLHSVGYGGISNLSSGKRFTFNLKAESLQKATEQTKALTDTILANPVIEDYEVKITLTPQEVQEKGSAS